MVRPNRTEESLLPAVFLFMVLQQVIRVVCIGLLAVQMPGFEVTNHGNARSVSPNCGSDMSPVVRWIIDAWRRSQSSVSVYSSFCFCVERKVASPKVASGIL